MHNEYFNEVRKHYLDQPLEISLETIALCNAACTFCPYPVIERKGEIMSSDLIRSLIDQMAEFNLPFYFSPFKVNEPLLDDRLIWICESMLERTLARIRLFTNGAALTQKKIDQIAALDRLVYLWISLNEHQPAPYKKLMNMDFDKTARRLDNLHAQDFPHPVILSAVGHPNDAFRRYCGERWPRFEVTLIAQSAWLGYTDSQADVVPDTSCSRWFELSIMANGVVSLCCMDGEGKFPIGDLNEDSLLTIYNSPHWRERRERMLSRLDVHPCNTCTYGG